MKLNKIFSILIIFALAFSVLILTGCEKTRQTANRVDTGSIPAESSANIDINETNDNDLIPDPNFNIYGLWEETGNSGYEIEINIDNTVKYFTHARLDAWEGNLSEIKTYNYQFHVKAHYMFRLGMEDMDEVWYFTYDPETTLLRYYDGITAYHFRKSTERQISILVLTPEILSKYISYKEYIDEERSAFERLIFTTYIAYRDFWFIKIGHNDDPFYLYVEDVLFQGELLPDLPFVVSLTELSRIPQRGISYLDGNNTRRYFYIGEHMIGDEHDGYYLSEFYIQD